MPPDSPIQCHASPASTKAQECIRHWWHVMQTSAILFMLCPHALGIRPSLGSMNPIKECLHHFAREDAQKRLLLVSRIMQYAGKNLPFL